MTKDDIKKALECCSKITLDTCKGCPYANNSEFNCVDGRMMKDALNLITEQEKEIERLKQRINIQCDAWQKLSNENKKLFTENSENLQCNKVLREENKRLRKENEKLKVDNEMLLINADTAQDQILQKYHEQQIKQAKIDVLTELRKFAHWAFGEEFLSASHIDEMIEEIEE